MANIKSAQELLDEIPKNDALKALLELTTWVESVREKAEFRVDHQLAVLRMIDETARPFARKLMRDYFASGTLSTFQENRLWMALNEFLGQTAHAYFNVLVRYRNGDKGSSAIKPAMPLVAVRGICAVAGKLKCAAARYALVEPSIWGCLAEFYSHAEAQQYLDERVSLYPESSDTTSVRCEFAAVLMWYACCANTLNRLHLHLSELLTDHLSKHFTVDAQCNPGSVIGFDLLHFAPPVRVNVENTPQTGLLFIGTNNLQPLIEALRRTLENKIVHEEINLGGACDAGPVREVMHHLSECCRAMCISYGANRAVHDVVRHLAECWSSTPPKRRNSRHSIKVNLNVTNGFSKILEQTDVGLNFGADNSVTWNVEDISTGGFRCVLPGGRMDGMAIGSLIGIKPENGDHWGVGIVRRMNRDKQNNLHVGVEKLTDRITGVGLREQGMDEEQYAMWLNDANDDPGEARLLMSHDTYSSSRSLHARLGGKSYLLMPLALEERGVDYDLARFRKIEKDIGSNEA